MKAYILGYFVTKSRVFAKNANSNSLSYWIMQDITTNQRHLN
jgi:hypothetical protein